jgi:hypothetical protein
MLPALTWNFRLGVRAIGKAAATPFTFHFSSPSSPRPAFHHLPPPLRSIAELKLDPPSPLTRSLGIGGCPWGACAFRSAPRPRLRGLPSRSSPTTSSAPSRGRRTPFTGLPTNEPTYEPTPRDSHSKEGRRKKEEGRRGRARARRRACCLFPFRSFKSCVCQWRLARVCHVVRTCVDRLSSLG